VKEASQETPMVATATKTEKPRLQKMYEESIAPKVMKEFGLSNVNELPKLQKVVINCGVGRHLENQKLKPEIRDTVIQTLSAISGQKPIMILARKSVANFKVREGAPSAFMVTLRGARAWHFLDRLMNLAIPRIKDFRGVKDSAFDKSGTYSMGLTEQAVWPEINTANITFTHGMHINIVFDRSDPKKSRFLLEELGMPFAKKDSN
jgi:large subunit ribosomal protein L5